MVSESARYYQTHPAARARKAAYDTKFESSPAQKAKYEELEKRYDQLLSILGGGMRKTNVG